MLQGSNNEDLGYLVQQFERGASNIALALSVNGNDTLDKSNKIIPADPNKITYSRYWAPMIPVPILTILAM